MKHPINAVFIFSLLSAPVVAQMDEHAMNHSTHSALGGEAISAPQNAPSMLMPEQHGSMQHQGHSPAMTMPVTTLTTLNAIPSSGRSREAGFDGRYAMEPTGKSDISVSRCAQGSRGLVMLSNVEWRGCGGKVAGASGSVSEQPAAMADHPAMKHSAMIH